MSNTTCPPLSYASYLQLSNLLELQNPFAARALGDTLPDGARPVVEYGERYFIRVHQIEELLLQGILAELIRARDLLRGQVTERGDGHVHLVPADHVGAATRATQRAALGLELLAAHIRAMEQLRPLDFLDFRDALGVASGFESFQFRAVEAVLGGRRRCGLAKLNKLATKADQYAAAAEPGSERQRVERATFERIHELSRTLERDGTLRAWLLHWLYRTPLGGLRPGMPDADDAAARFREAWISSWWEWRRHNPKADPNERERLDRFLRGEDVAQAHALREAHKLAMRLLSPGDVSRQADAAAWWSRIRSALLVIETYDDLPQMASARTLVNNLVDIEMNLKFWRDRHARMTERFLGSRPGTGGSSGASALDKTRTLTFLPELVSFRTYLMPRSHRPPWT